MTEIEKAALCSQIIATAKVLSLHRFGGRGKFNFSFVDGTMYSRIKSGVLIAQGVKIDRDTIKLEFYSNVSFSDIEVEDCPTASLVILSKEDYANARARLTDFFLFDIIGLDKYKEVIEV